MKRYQFVLIFIVCFLSQACSTPAKEAEVHFQKGKKYFEEHNLSLASMEFSYVISLNKKHADTYYYLGLIDEANKNWQAMYTNMTQAILMKPELMPAHIKLANLEVLGNKFEEAKKEIDYILQVEPENIEGLVLKGTVFLKQKNKQEALDISDKVLELDSNNIRAILFKTNIYIDDKNYKAALELIDNAIKQNHNELALFLLKLQIYQLQDDKYGLEEVYITLIKRVPDNIDYRYALINLYAADKRYGDADALYNAILVKYPNNFFHKKSFIDYLRKRDGILAEKTLLEFIDKQPDMNELYLLLSRYYIEDKKFEKAKEILIRLIKTYNEHNGIVNKLTVLRTPKDILEAKNLLAELEFQSNNYQEADNYLSQVLEVDYGNYDALLLQVKILRIKNETDQVLSMLRGMVLSYPDKEEPFVLLAKTYLSLGNQSLADEAFRSAAIINPGNFEATLPVIEKMIARKDLKRAEEFLNKALQANPNSKEGNEALARVKSLEAAER